jgi:hypothetical protein
VRGRVAGWLESAGMSPALGIVVESSVAAEIVYGEGVFWAVILIAFVFVFVAHTDGYWFIGTGVFAALVSALFIFSAWHWLADHPLTRTRRCGWGNCPSL